MVNTMKKSKNNSNIQSIFTSKSNVLKFLKKQLKFSKIEPIFDFTVDDWKNDQENVLKEIKHQKNIFLLHTSILKNTCNISTKIKWCTFQKQSNNYS